VEAGSKTRFYIHNGSLSIFEFLFGFIILEILMGHKYIHIYVWNLSACPLEQFSERKKNSMMYKWVSINLVFPLELRFFLSFIIQEIVTGQKRKLYGIFLHVHRKNLVKEKQIPWCRVSISLVFPIELQFFWHSLFETY